MKLFFSVKHRQVAVVSVALSMICFVSNQTVVAQKDVAQNPMESSKVSPQIDQLIEKRLQELNLKPVAISDDVEFLRRVYLDVTGRVPTAEQAAAFLDNKDSNKRSQLIDELLNHENSGEQFGRVWRDWIAPAELPSEGNGGNQPIKATRDLGVWFGEQFNKNRPWDQVVSAVITADGTLKEHPQGLFYSLSGTDTGIPEPAGATRAISSLFLGLDLQCAQCHDDPYRTEWKQTDFWGVAAFFKNVEGKFNGRYFDSLTESFGKKLSKGAKKVTTKDKSENGAITIPEDSFKNAGDIVNAKLIWSDAVDAKDEQPLRPIIAKWVTAKENPYFARAFANRVWSYYFSQGIVTPIDDMRPDNPATHPEVLELLSKEFTDSNFDMKHLMRCMLNTKAYQRTSDSKDDVEKKVVKKFGRREIKLLSADQLYDSLKLALTDNKLDLRTYDKKEASRFGESSPVGDEYTEFQRLFETDENDAKNFTHGIPQFLALINHPRVTAESKTVEELIKKKVEPSTAVEQLYLSTLSRRPTEMETKEAIDFIEQSETQSAGYSGVLWMLLNRSEFMLLR